MKKYYASFSAVYNISVTVDAESEEEAIQKVKDGYGEVHDESFSYIHPETEFFIEEDE